MDFFGSQFGDLEPATILGPSRQLVQSSPGKIALEEAERLEQRLEQQSSIGIGLSGGPLIQYFCTRLDRLADEVCER